MKQEGAQQTRGVWLRKCAAPRCERRPSAALLRLSMPSQRTWVIQIGCVSGEGYCMQSQDCKVKIELGRRRLKRL